MKPVGYGFLVQSVRQLNGNPLSAAYMLKSDTIVLLLIIPRNPSPFTDAIRTKRLSLGAQRIAVADSTEDKEKETERKMKTKEPNTAGVR